MNVIAIGYSKHLFSPEDQERPRMVACAKAAGVVHMIIFSHESEGFKEQVIEGVLHLHPTNARSRVGKFFTALRIGWRLIKAERKAPWVITAQDPFETGIVASLLSSRFGVPYNVQEHGDFYSTPHWRNESFMHRVRAYVGKQILLEADSVRVVSKRVGATLQKLGVAKTKIHQLPVIVDTTRFIGVLPNPTLIPNYAPHKRYILSVARFVPQKNISLLIRAFARVRSYHKEAELILVGKGVEETLIKKTIQTVGDERITVLPWSENVPALMATAHLYALSSNYEGWGRVLIEAVASGLPIVTTDVGCAGEALTQDMYTHIVPVGAEAAFAAALTAALKRGGRRPGGSNVASPSYETYANDWVRILEQTRTHTV